MPKASDGNKKYKPDTVRAAFRKYFVGEESEDGEQRAFCPICEDPSTSTSPSASINPSEGLWNCLKGNHGGSIYSLVADLKKERGFNLRSEALKGKHQDPEFSERISTALKNSSPTGKRTTPLPDADQIDNWTSRLMASGKALADLTSQRGFSHQTIIDFNIGWDGSRYTIPIYDELGDLANVRRYKLNASSANDKMLNHPGHGTARIFGLDTLLENEDVLLTEGETDRLLAMQYGIPSVTHTGGAGTFRAQWGPLFAGKRVWVCYDNDESGHKGAAKAASFIRPYADAVFIMRVPLEHKGADVTDYLYKEGHSTEDFRSLMKEAEEEQSGNQTSAPIAESGVKMSLMDSMAQQNQNETIELVVSVAGKQAEPFTAPKRILATCDMSKGAACSACPISARNGEAEIEVRPDDEQVFRFIDTTEQRRKAILREVTGARCTDRVEYELPEDYHIEELLVQPSVDERREDETQQPIRRTVFSVSTHRTAVNEKLRIVGKNVPDPKTGRLRFMAWHNEPVEMDIDNFKMTPEMQVRLSHFRPTDDQSPLDKCLEIAGDMAENVTHIYGRAMLHVAYDLVWHSVQSFRAYGNIVPKGWLEMVVVGDTRTGKSEVANKLIRHYRSGTLLSCEGMSFAGIVGGVQQIDGRWHLTWGAVPMNDRRLVVLDEMSGLKDKDVIDQMSSIRSSGVAQITKISSEQTSARTRLVWITNPADGSMLHDFPDVGMAALKSVVPNNEDIARFDFAVAAAKDEVEDTVINAAYGGMYSPEYRPEDCELLIKWAWSLTRDDVIISEKAQQAARKSALEVGRRYIADPPLIQSENVRFKILRIACALAARTFSANKQGKLLVHQEHVVDAVRFLDAVYSTEAMGYSRKSRRTITASERARERRSACVSYLRENADTVLQTLQMVGGKTFRTRDFSDFAAMSSEAAQVAVKKLMSWKMAHMKSRGDIGMDPVLIEILRALEDEDDV